MGGIAYQLFHLVNPVLHRWDFLNSKIALFISMSIAAGVAASVYGALLYWWKYPERDMLTDALNKVKQRFGIKSDA
jgi:hypothetical protein